MGQRVGIDAAVSVLKWHFAKDHEGVFKTSTFDMEGRNDGVLHACS